MRVASWIVPLLAATAVVLLAPAAARPSDDPVAQSAHDVAAAATATYRSGFSPAQVQGAYGFSSLSCAPTCGTGQTVAIVDAYDNATIEADLAAFSTQFALPQCTTANGCLRKATPQGQPGADGGWALEIALDVQWVHAVAPGAKILLVEAADARVSSLMAAVDYAVAQGASVVSMSWGATEFSGETSWDSHFDVAGVSFVASSGDDGHEVDYPAASPYVTSVGGTSLTLDGTGAISSETAWNGSSGGVSTVESTPAYQSGLSLPKRGVPDVSLVADPATGVAVDTGGLWYVVGGTSASAPMWGALLASANQLRGSAIGAANAALYTAPSSDFRDIVSGTNGTCGAPCSAAAGYDLVTGRGSAKADILAPLLTGATVAFTSTAPSLTAGVASGALTLQLGADALADTTVTLKTSSSGGGFSTSATGPWTATLAATVTSGSRTAPSFYYRDTRAGSATLTASATGYANATQTATVVAATTVSLAVSPTAVSLTAGGQQTLTANDVDAFGNTVPVTASWSASGLGSFSGSTFTATSAGSGTITATIGTLTVTLPLTVSAPPPPPPSDSGGGGGGGGGGGAQPDLSLTIATDRPPALNAPVTYRVVVFGKAGNGQTDHATLTVALPDQVQLGGVSLDHGPGCAVDGHTVECDLGFVIPGQDVHLAITGTVTAAGTLTATGTVWALAEDNTGDNTVGLTQVVGTGTPAPQPPTIAPTPTPTDPVAKPAKLSGAAGAGATIRVTAAKPGTTIRWQLCSGSRCTTIHGATGAVLKIQPSWAGKRLVAVLQRRVGEKTATTKLATGLIAR